jgi:hypothetical protein
MTTQGFPHDRLVAVYPSRADADRVAEDLVAAGVDRALVRIADPDDQSKAMVGEMREETGNSWLGMSSGLVTKEQTKGSLTLAPITAVVGALFGALIGLALVGTMPLWGRLLLGLVIGALFGGVVGMVVGAGLGARGPAARGAAAGTPLSVGRTDDLVRGVLASHRVVRIDLVHAGGNPIEVIHTEEDRTEGGQVDRLKERFSQPTGGDWGVMAPEEPRPEH